jgi:ankyrin repeat protein
VYLRHCVPACILRALDELPQTLDETYSRALKQIDKPNWEYAHRLFQCVTAALRPFRVEELAEFLAFNFEAGATPTFLANWRLEDPTHTMISTRSSLLAVIYDEPVQRYLISPAVTPDYHTSTLPEFPVTPTQQYLRDGSAPFIPPHLGPTPAPPIFVHPAGPSYASDSYSTTPSIESPRSPPLAAQFAHFSVKEYLTSARLSEERDTISRFHVSMAPAHTIIAQACLGVLLHLDENITNKSLKEFPLSEYAAEHWVDHVRFENVASNVLDGMKRLFDPSKNHLSVWVWIYDPELSSRDRLGRSERPAAARATPLHYAAFCGMHDIATFLIIEHSQDVNARGFDKKETPLHVALRQGHVEVIRVLLEHGADAEARNKDNRTPLLWASRLRHVELAQVLLEHGADTEARDGDNCTPLLCASRDGQVELARVLLKHGADTEARDEDDYSPLERATQKGHVELVQILLEHGADVSAQNKRGHTPLHWASAMGQPAVGLVLLRHGADLKARCKSNHTPLHCANGEEVTRFLLEQGADANALDILNGTPLHHVSELGRVGPARVLLEHGADANARDANNATPLHLASEPVNPSKDGQYLAVVLLLIQYGSDVHARDDKGQTPFMRAEEASQLRLLLPPLFVPPSPILVHPPSRSPPPRRVPSPPFVPSLPFVSSPYYVVP